MMLLSDNVDEFIETLGDVWGLDWEIIANILDEETQQQAEERPLSGRGRSERVPLEYRNESPPPKRRRLEAPNAPPEIRASFCNFTGKIPLIQTRVAGEEGVSLLDPNSSNVLNRDAKQ